MDKLKRDEMLFEEFLEVWLAEIYQTHAVSTYVKYSRIAVKHIKPYFREFSLKEVTPTLLCQFRDQMKISRDVSEGGMKSDTLLRDCVMIVNLTMKLAASQGLVCPWVSVSCSRKKRNPLVSVFSTEEQARLEKYMKENWDQTAFGIYLCLYTGMRLGEICALKWENINIEEGYLTVYATVQRLPVGQEDKSGKSRLLLSPPKSSASVRRIPFPSFLLPVLEQSYRTATKDSFVLTAKPMAPMEHRTFQYQYKRYLSKAGIPYHNFHTIRHTFATRCITSGMDPKTLSEILGHSDIKITMDYYFHSSFEFKKNQMEKLTALA